MSEVCERCNYDEVDPNARIPEFFKPDYDKVCKACAKKLQAITAYMEEVL